MFDQINFFQEHKNMNYFFKLVKILKYNVSGQKWKSKLTFQKEIISE